MIRALLVSKCGSNSEGHIRNVVLGVMMFSISKELSKTLSSKTNCEL